MTRSICPECRWPIDAQIILRQGKVYMRKRCPQHGRFETLVYADAQAYSRQRSTQLDHPAYGAVTIDVWTDLHVAGAPPAPFSVVRVQVERLPNKKLPPRPLWLAWLGGALPADLSVL